MVKTFKCQPNCGACCKTGGVLIVDTDRAAEALRAIGVIPDSSQIVFSSWFPPGPTVSPNDRGWCPALGEGDQCRIYEDRPTQCRTYPNWPYVIANWEKHKAVCPGLDAPNGEPL